MYPAPSTESVSLPITSITTAYTLLGTQVESALRTQMGDAARLAEQKRLCLMFLSHVQQVYGIVSISLIQTAHVALACCQHVYRGLSNDL